MVTRISTTATMLTTILDRLVHNAYPLELKGESLRKPGGPAAAQPEPAEQ